MTTGKEIRESDLKLLHPLLGRQEKKSQAKECEWPQETRKVKEIFS